MDPPSVDVTELSNEEPIPELGPYEDPMPQLDPFEDPIPHVDPYGVTVGVLTALTVVLILTLNPIGLVVLCRAKGIQETTKVFMASLTVTDTCIGLFWVLPELTQQLTGKWVLGAFLCTVWGVSSLSLLTLSIFSLILLTVDRFVAIVYSLRYPTLMTLKTAKTIVAITWILTLTFFIIVFGFFLPSTVSTDGPDECGLPVCEICWVLLMSLMATSLVTIFGLYTYILNVARQQARRIAAQNQIGIAWGDQNAPQRVSTKSATTVIIITMTVFICWTPAIIYIVTNPVINHLDIPDLFVAAKLIFFTNSWLNVFIYYLRNKELRQALHELLASRFRR